VPPGLASVLAIRLIEGLSDGGGHDGVLAFRDMGERVANPMYTAALPTCIEEPSKTAHSCVLVMFTVSLSSSPRKGT